VQIEITNYAIATQLAAQAGYSVEEYVNKLIEEASDLEAIREGLNDVEAGRTTPLREFDQEFRKEKGFSPKADA
jgi:predicted transcriptional regulator